MGLESGFKLPVETFNYPIRDWVVGSGAEALAAEELEKFGPQL